MPENTIASARMAEPAATEPGPAVSPPAPPIVPVGSPGPVSGTACDRYPREPGDDAGVTGSPSVTPAEPDHRRSLVEPEWMAQARRDRAMGMPASAAIAALLLDHIDALTARVAEFDQDKGVRDLRNKIDYLTIECQQMKAERDALRATVSLLPDNDLDRWALDHPGVRIIRVADGGGP